MEDLITAKRLRWLGHLVQLDKERIPKKILFGWLPESRPTHGTKLRWRDRVRKTLIEEKIWYVMVQDSGVAEEGSVQQAGGCYKEKF